MVLEERGRRPETVEPLFLVSQVINISNAKSSASLPNQNTLKNQPFYSHFSTQEGERERAEGSVAALIDSCRLPFRLNFPWENSASSSVSFQKDAPAETGRKDDWFLSVLFCVCMYAAFSTSQPMWQPTKSLRYIVPSKRMHQQRGAGKMIGSCRVEPES